MKRVGRKPPSTARRPPPESVRHSTATRARSFVNLGLFLAAIGGAFSWIVSPAPGPRGSPEFGTAGVVPPQPQYVRTSSGVRVARIDVDRLSSWCKAVGLPNPPPIEQTDAAVADALIEALGRAARTRSPEAFGVVGQICESLECLRHAEEYFLRAVRDDPRDFRWLYHLGCVYQQAGQHQRAITVFSRALTLDAEYAVTHARLGQLYMDAGHLDDAEEHLRRYAALRPEDWLGPVGLGRVAILRGDSEAALRHLQEAAAINPNDFQVQYNLGRVRAARGEATLAKKHFDLAERLPQGRWFRTRDPLLQESDRLTGAVSNLVGEFERRQSSGDWAALAGLAEQIIERRAGDATMMGNLASLYRKLKRFDAAKEVLGRALRLKPDSPRLHAIRAGVYFSAGDTQAAITAALEAIRIDPDNGRAYNVLGRALFMSKRRQADAEAAMRRAVTLDPDNPATSFVLGEILRAGGRIEEATGQYRRVIELQPDHPHARERLAQLLRRQPQ